MSFFDKDRATRVTGFLDFASQLAQLASGDALASANMQVLTATGVDVSAAFLTATPTLTIASPRVTFTLYETAASTDQTVGSYTIKAQATTVQGATLTQTAPLVVTSSGPFAAPVATVTLSPSAAQTIYLGGSVQLTATAKSASGAVVSYPAVWTPSDRTKATVDANGLVAAIGIGTATISVTIGGVTQTVAFTVSLKTTQLVAQETVVALVLGHLRNGAYTPKDANGAVTTDPVTYRSTNAAAATVDVNTGAITPVAPGGPVDIIATCGTVTQTRTFTVYADLVPTLAWEPLAGQTWPRVWTPDPNQTANQGTWAQPFYAGGYGLCRTVPYSPDRWALADAGAGTAVGYDPGGFAGAVNASYVANADALPFDSTPAPHSLRFTFSAAPGAIWLGFSAQSKKSATDPISPLRRYGGGLQIRAASAADVGKTVDMIIGPVNDTANIKIRKPVTLLSNTQWQWAYVDLRNQAEAADANTLWGIGTSTTGTTAMQVDVIYNDFVGGLGEDCLPGFGGWLTQWGLPAEQNNVNAWPPDSDKPALYNGTTSAPTTEFGPDSAIYFDGAPYTDYWMPVGGGIMTQGPINVRNVAVDNLPGKAVWAMAHAKPNGGGHMPNDGDLQATFVVAGGVHTYGPINLVRDPTALRGADGRSFYRARIPINLASEGYTAGTLYIKNATASPLAVTIQRCAAVVEDSRTVGWHQCLAPRRNLRVQPPAAAPTLVAATTGGTLATGTYFYVVTALDPAGESLASAEASIAVTGPTGKVTLTWPAVSGATGYTVYRGTAAAGENAYYTLGNVTTYADTNAASTAGSPPTTAPWVWQSLCWMQMRDASSPISVSNGVMGVRLVVPYAVGDVINQGQLGGPGVWQTGPIGSSDYNFDCSFDPNGASPRIIITMNRAFAGYDSWKVTIPIPNGSTYLPAFSAFDIIVAWKNRLQIAVGIGSGAGSDITWLQNGATYLGGTVTWEQVAGTTWEYGTTGSHIIGFADRDQTRMTGGWIQDVVMAKVPPVDGPTAQIVLSEYVRQYWGNRPSY